MKLKLEAGKRYVTRRGEVTGVMHYDSAADQPFTAVFDGEWHSWSKNGCFMNDDESGMDLVSEHVEPVIRWTHKGLCEVLYESEQDAEYAYGEENVIRVQVTPLPDTTP